MKKIVEDLNLIQKSTERLLKLTSLETFKVDKETENKITKLCIEFLELTNSEMNKELKRQKDSGKKFISDEQIDNVMEEVKSDFDLAEQIEKFLEKYAAISPNYKSEDDDKYTGPDPYQLKACAILLKEGKKMFMCHSDWSSGCYKPYSSSEGRIEHDRLVKEIYKRINKK